MSFAPRALLLASLLLAPGCLRRGPAEVKLGELEVKGATKVLLLTPTCTAKAGGCSHELTTAVLGEVAHGLETLSLTAIDGADLGAKVHGRADQGPELKALDAELTSLEARPAGGPWMFGELTAPSRKTFLGEGKALGVVQSRVTLGTGSFKQATVEIRFSVRDADEMVWSASCTHEYGFTSHAERASAAAAKCAMEALAH